MSDMYNLGMQSVEETPIEQPIQQAVPAPQQIQLPTPQPINISFTNPQPAPVPQPMLMPMPAQLPPLPPPAPLPPPPIPQLNGKVPNNVAKGAQDVYLQDSAAEQGEMLPGGALPLQPGWGGGE